MDDYRDIEDLLKPRKEIKASDELRERVRLALASGHSRRFNRKWIWGGISACAAAVMLVFLLVPTGMSATDLLKVAINSLRKVEKMEMVVEIRTRPVENFKYIDVNEDFVTHHIDITNSDSVMSWRIDKGDRVATGRNGDINTWIKSLKLGWHVNTHDKAAVIGYLANLLTPQKILEVELEQCMQGSDSKYTVTKKGKEIQLVVHAMPQGDFGNPYLLNSSIEESENIRRYVIDADTKRLKSASVSVVSGKREIVVLKISSITYNPGVKTVFALPPDVQFVETEKQLPGLNGLSAEEAATVVLNAFSTWNKDILDKVMYPAVSDISYRKRFSGAKLLSVGNAFVSGNHNSTFIPYRLRLKDGTIQRHYLALRKNDTGGWIVIGG